MITEDREQLTMATFVESAGLRMDEPTRVDRNPTMPDSTDMDHWRIVLRRGGKRMTIVFSMGYGHQGKPPKLGDVLECLASDAGSVDNTNSFEDWASELRYDTDSRKAHSTYKSVWSQASKLKLLLDADNYETLLYRVER